jgi:hypothetical protein
LQEGLEEYGDLEVVISPSIDWAEEIRSLYVSGDASVCIAAYKLG